MSGRITTGERRRRRQHDHVVLTLDDGTVVRFNDARRFGLIDYHAAAARRRAPAARRDGARAARPRLRRRLSRRALAGKMTPIKSALLDQSIVAGLGNIYVCEALYRARLSPRRLAATIAGARADAAGRRRSAPCSTRRSKPAARRCATMSRRTASSAISSIAGRSTARRASPAPAALARRGAPHRPVRPLDFLLRQAAALSKTRHCEERVARRSNLLWLRANETGP